MTQGFSFIDLFAGIGGLRQAMESIGGHCVFTSEWDKFAKLTYEANYKDNRKIEDDIRNISADMVPDHNVLCAGFPCQPFSLAGVSKRTRWAERMGFSTRRKALCSSMLCGFSKQNDPRHFS